MAKAFYVARWVEPQFIRLTNRDLRSRGCCAIRGAYVSQQQMKGYILSNQKSCHAYSILKVTNHKRTLSHACVQQCQTMVVKKGLIRSRISNATRSSGHDRATLDLLRTCVSVCPSRSCKAERASRIPHTDHRLLPPYRRSVHFH